MKKFSFLAFMAFSCMSMYSCKDNDAHTEIFNSRDGQIAITQIGANTGSSSVKNLPATRTTDVDTWESTDKLGITMCYAYPDKHPENKNQNDVYYDQSSSFQPVNACYTFNAYVRDGVKNSATFIPAIINGQNQSIWLPTDTTIVNLFAYYPWRPTGSDPKTQLSSDGKFPISVERQKDDKGNSLLPQIDVLWGSVEKIDKHNSSVEFMMQHVLSQVVFKFEPAMPADTAGLSVEDLQDVDVFLTHQRTNGVFDIYKNYLDYKEGDSKITFYTEPIVDQVTKERKGCEARAIILPFHAERNKVLHEEKPSFDEQTRLDKNVHMGLYLKKYKKTLYALMTDEFKAGYRYTYTVKVTLNKIVVTGTIVEWIDVKGDDINL